MEKIKYKYNNSNKYEDMMALVVHVAKLGNPIKDVTWDDNCIYFTTIKENNYYAKEQKDKQLWDIQRKRT